MQLKSAKLIEDIIARQTTALLHKVEDLDG